ncbi:uncharacterized protein LOC134076173 [Sardina pilchardus]|uniref:uncharacterized protein LOC134076173 n=1 Tax=Sardina pilchardus TaxID=27697 RepID=UPI002E10171E
MEQPCPQPSGLNTEQQVALLGQIVEQVELKEEEQKETRHDVQAPQSIPLQQEGGEETALNTGPGGEETALNTGPGGEETALNTSPVGEETALNTGPGGEETALNTALNTSPVGEETALNTALNTGSVLEPASTDAPSSFPVAIESLLLRPFRLRSPQEKKDVVSRGRPTPDLDLTEGVEERTQRFSSWHYSRKPWLTGCPKSNQLFCWPCLLFSTESFVWTEGFRDLTDLHEASERHESSVQHIGHMMHLHTLKHERLIRHSASTRAELSAEQHYKQKRILKVLTEAAIILGSREYNPLFEEEDSEDSEDSSAFVDLVKSLVKDNDKLATLIDPDSFYSGLSDDLEDRLTESVEEVVLDEIKAEIRDAGFVSLILHETTDDSWDTQIATVLRYATKEGLPQERFVEFTDAMEKRTASALTEYVLTFLQKMDCGDKLVALSYSGQGVSSSQISGLVAQVKERYPWVIFRHWCALELSVAVAQSCHSVKDASLFLGVLQDLSRFFLNTFLQRGVALENIVRRRASSTAPLLWNNISEVVKTMKEHSDSVIELFDKILDSELVLDNDSFFRALRLLPQVVEPKFKFLLEVFSAVFFRMDELGDALQRNSVETGCGASALKRTLEALTAMHGDFDSIFSQTVEPVDNPAKRGKWEDETKEVFRGLYVSVLDTLISELEVRFDSLAKTTFTELLDFSKFTAYDRTFPEEAFRYLKETCGRFFDFALLRNELQVLYASYQFEKKNMCDLVDFLHNTGLNGILTQVSKLCELSLAMQLGTPKQKKSSSVLGRIEACNDYASGQGNSLFLTIERTMLDKMQDSDGFHDRVSRRFAERGDGDDLAFV